MTCLWKWQKLRKVKKITFISVCLGSGDERPQTPKNTPHYWDERYRPDPSQLRTNKESIEGKTLGTLVGSGLFKVNVEKEKVNEDKPLDKALILAEVLYYNLAEKKNINKHKENKWQVSKQNEKEYMNDLIPIGEHSPVDKEVECGDFVVM